ncbi:MULTISPECIES: DUF6493 family protein [unclassified Streptomyces]|uniref:DUF7824 domain-containing protein n=1 Tax=unclassified Streptomyces TaxID=2593676 RepID=UPI00224ED198|nr:MULTISPECIES: DUF6493 family protein [unclassified Streptomyces]MCX4524194.1 DUF6493 family protein [Streptomyces sp. NBC_01551]MCX4545287.1 DUF6493 family protein [Streptomyces sp. NBC_01565]
MSQILDAVRAGRTSLLPLLVKRLTVPERRAMLAELTTLRREIRDWDWTQRRAHGSTGSALLVAGAGCHTGAAAAAAWIGARDLNDGLLVRGGTVLPHLLAVLGDREPAWLGDVAHRLAGRAATVEANYPLIRELITLADCPAPTTDGFVHAWADSMVSGGFPRSARRPLSVALREDPRVRELVPLLFQTAEPAATLSWYADPQAPDHWPSELTALAAEGIVERRVLVDGCVSRLLRGGRPGALKFYQVLLQRLDLTPAELREHTADWIAMTADAPSAPAGHAQQVLAGLSEAGELAAEPLAQMSAGALFRPEKKLVRAQLVLLGKALGRDPETRHVLLPAVAGAFGHADTAIQERALKLVAKHLRPGDDELRMELVFQADLLGPVHRKEAAALLGADTESGAAFGDEPPYEEILPPAPVRRRLPAEAQTLAETVEMVAALANSRNPTVAEFESTLDGLVRHAHHDRAALAAALRPALADRWWAKGDEQADAGRVQGIELVAAAVLGCVRAYDLRPERVPRSHGFHQDCVHAVLSTVVAARLTEAAYHTVTGPLPFLLATPTWDTGSLEPEELVERLAAYGRLGAGPAPADFAQALLRVRRDPAAAEAARALGTREGERLAAWLTTAGEPPEQLRRVREPDVSRRPRGWDQGWETIRRVVLETRERPVVQGEFPAAFHKLGRPYTGGGGRCYHWNPDGAAYAAVLPEDRETQAAWLLPEMTVCAALDGRGAGAWLSRLAELGGPAGPAVHLVVATALGARHPEDRLAAVDALLVLAARGELDTGLLGRDIAELVRLGTVKPNRLADAARTLAATGAYATTWAALSEALPALLADGAAIPRGAGELLAVAAECVERSGAGGPGPGGLAALASRTGSSQLVTQARRLRQALAAGEPEAVTA